MPIPSDQIEAIRERLDIVRVIGSFVDLKKKGRRYVGLCPFHAEKTPSFSVTAEKGLYYCFGCHAGGDVFSFLMRHQGLDFQAAARKLAKDAGVELEPESESDRKRRKMEADLVRANEFALAFFEHALWRANAKRAQKYLSGRGIGADLSRARRLGYGGGAGEMLRYLEAKNVPAMLAASAGLLTEDGRRSLFEERLVFPIFDATGRIAGFGARRLGDGPGPKYINSRESPVFSKRRLLYGWDVAQEAIRRSGRVILVEGYTDVLACQQAGAEQAVAALGTSFTEDHARQCARFAKEAIVFFDGDAAGQRASMQVVEKTLAAKLRSLVAPLPAGQDPDGLLRAAGHEALRAQLDGARPALEFYMEAAFDGLELSIEQRAEAARELSPLLMALPAGLERDLYSARLAERVGVSVEQLWKHLRAGPRRRKPASDSRPGGAQEPMAPPSAAPSKQELQELRELLLFPSLRPRLAELSEYASDPMRALLEELAASDQPLDEVVGRHIPDPRLAAWLASVDPARGDSDEETTERAERTLADVKNRFKRRYMSVSKEVLRQELRDLEARGEPTEEVARRIKSLTRREKELKRPGSTV